jgi:hypothetical protein
LIVQKRLLAGCLSPHRRKTRDRRLTMKKDNNWWNVKEINDYYDNRIWLCILEDRIDIFISILKYFRSRDRLKKFELYVTILLGLICAVMYGILTIAIIIWLIKRGIG